MSSLFKNLFNNPPTSLSEELIAYQALAEEARKKGRHKLADQWELTNQLIKAFVQYLNSSRQLSFLEELLEQPAINNRTIEIQEIAHQTASSLTALKNYNIPLAQDLMQYAEEIKEAGIRYRYWLSLIKDEISIDHSLGEPSLQEIAAQYNTNALKATEEKKEAIAQHWREASCLVQEALRKKEFSLSAYITAGNEMLATYWELSKVASQNAAKLKAEVALSLEQGNTALAEEYDNLALVTELLSSYQENLVRCIINGEIEVIPHWKSAAKFLNKSLVSRYSLEPFKKNYHCSSNDADDTNSFEKGLKKSSENEPLLAYKKMIIACAEQAAESHREVISQLQKKRKISLNSIEFAEQSYEAATQALQFCEEQKFSDAETLKKRVSLANDAYQFSRKATQAKEKWYTLGIPFLYWKYRVKKVARALQKTRAGLPTALALAGT